MTPDDSVFIQFAIKAGFTLPEDLDHPEQLQACQAYLVQHEHQIWAVQEALQIVLEDTDTELSSKLLARLIHWFFIIKF